MSKEIEELNQVLQHNLEIVQLLSKRVEILENSVEENAAQRMSVMLLLRAFVRCSPNQAQVAALAQRMAAQMQAQPGILVDGGKNTFQRMKAHLDWMTAAPQQPD